MFSNVLPQIRSLLNLPLELLDYLNEHEFFPNTTKTILNAFNRAPKKDFIGVPRASNKSYNIKFDMNALKHNFLSYLNFILSIPGKIIVNNSIKKDNRYNECYIIKDERYVKIENKKIKKSLLFCFSIAALPYSLLMDICFYVRKTELCNGFAEFMYDIISALSPNKQYIKCLNGDAKMAIIELLWSMFLLIPSIPFVICKDLIDLAYKIPPIIKDAYAIFAKNHAQYTKSRGNTTQFAGLVTTNTNYPVTPKKAPEQPAPPDSPPPYILPRPSL